MQGTRPRVPVVQILLVRQVSVLKRAAWRRMYGVERIDEHAPLLSTSDRLVEIEDGRRDVLQWLELGRAVDVALFCRGGSACMRFSQRSGSMSQREEARAWAQTLQATRQAPAHARHRQ